VTTFNSGAYYFGCVDLGPGAVVSINGGVTFVTQCFKLEAGATISGVGTGYQGGQGPGPGGAAVTFMTPGPDFYEYGAGGGHGGAGATVCVNSGNCGNGGPANDDPVHPALLGSPGFYTLGASPWPQSFGGGLLKVVVFDPVANTVAPATINGTIDMSGLFGNQNSGSFCDDGGGAGGAIMIEASSVNGTGLLQANGGTAQLGGGSGGGGIISLIENSTSFSGSISVSGGAGNSPGQNGTVTFTTAPISGY
jgi:hypothetical protein